jgi:hypothetical protein
MLKTDPLGTLKMIPRAAKLFIRGRMPITSHKIKGTAELEKCVEEMTEVSGLHAGSTRGERS